MGRLYTAFRTLPRSQRHLLLEAAVLTAVVSAGLRIARLAALRRVLDRYAAARRLTDLPPDHTSTIAAVRWAVIAIARRFPPATCLVQALATDVMLRRRGASTELRIGVRRRRASGAVFESHAWVTCNEAVAIGAVDDLSDFKVLLTLTPGRRA
jgi:hypothetical protein